VKEYGVLKNPGPDVYDSRVVAKKYKEKAYVPARR
jgi:hypothetical protein